MWPDRMEFQISSIPDKNEGRGGAEDKQAAAWVDMEIFKNPKRFYIWSANI